MRRLSSSIRLRRTRVTFLAPHSSGLLSSQRMRRGRKAAALGVTVMATNLQGAGLRLRVTLLISRKWR